MKEYGKKCALFWVVIMGNYIRNVANILYLMHNFKVCYINLFSLTGFRLHFVSTGVLGGRLGELVYRGHVLELKIVNLPEGIQASKNCKCKYF